MIKIFYWLLSLVIIVVIAAGIYAFVNRNTIVDTTVKTEYGVEVTVQEYSKSYSNFRLQRMVDKYESDQWKVELLNPPAYPYMYKINNRGTDSIEVALWYSGKYLLTLQANNLFEDGSTMEQVLEDYLKSYPSMVDPKQKNESGLLTFLENIF